MNKNPKKIVDKAIKQETVIPAPAIKQIAKVIENTKSEKIAYDNDVMRIDADSFGAKINSIVVKKFKKEDSFVDIYSNFGDFDSFALNFDYNNSDLSLNNKNWALSLQDSKLAYDFTYLNKLKIAKELWIDKNYFGKVKLSFKNISGETANLSNLKLHFGLSQDSKSSVYHQVVIFSEGKITRVKPNKKDETKEFDIKNGWIGIRDQYFCYIFSSNNIENVLVKNNSNQTIDVYLKFKDIQLLSKSSQNIDINCYFGPQSYYELKKSEYKFHKIVDFGFFQFIGVAMLYCLKFFYSVTKNYGLAIILLTILIRAILWWPTQKSYTSMKKMQTSMNKMQPRLKTLKEIYRDNPQKLNEETMKLYKEYQINPMGGCLPMLLQMPVFFALYATLNSAVELKGSGFIWIWKDLSLKDPLYILPVLMGITMFIQQKMSTPPAATPEAETQQKIMLYLMPAMLTFFAFMWPSGLLLYWVVSNIASIAQQVIINRKS
jgi:YidC/Oxa1 family membrane protein insertase